MSLNTLSKEVAFINSPTEIQTKNCVENAFQLKKNCFLTVVLSFSFPKKM